MYVNACNRDAIHTELAESLPNAQLPHKKRPPVHPSYLFFPFSKSFNLIELSLVIRTFVCFFNLFSNKSCALLFIISKSTSKKILITITVAGRQLRIALPLLARTCE